MRITGNVRLRPVRVGLLVSPSDLASVRRFMRLNTCIWGGRLNPIIPIFDKEPEGWSHQRNRKRGLEVARNYINYFQPDMLVESEAGMAESLGWIDSISSIDIPRVVKLAEFFSDGDDQRTKFKGSIDVDHIFADLYEKEYQFERRHKNPYVFFDPDIDAGGFFEAVFGTYPNDKSLKFIPEGYRQVFEPDVLTSSPDTYNKLILENYLGPNFLTHHALTDTIHSRSDRTLYIFDPDNALDLLDFWNYRYANTPVIPVNLAWLDHCSDLIRKNIQNNHRPYRGYRSELMGRTAILFGRSINDAFINEFSESLAQHVPRTLSIAAAIRIR